MSAYDIVTDALLRVGSTQKGHDWTCPVHKGGAERDPSLSVNEGEKGVVMKCQAGCDNETVLRAIGLKIADLFDSASKSKMDIVATYDYTDESGELLFQVVRLYPKDFRQRVPLGGDKWKWSIKDTRRVLYHLPALLAGVSAGEQVFICEGEKDVEAIERLGGIATCNPGGAGKWRDEYNAFFKGTNVVIISDNDIAGKAHAEQVSKSLGAVAASLMVVSPKEGKDAADHIASGFTLDEFVPGIVDITDERVEVAKPTNSLRSRLLDIDEIDDVPPPTYVIEDLVVADSLCVLFGLPGNGKSFIAIDWALSVAHGCDTWLDKKVQTGGVLYVVAEGLSGIGMRKKAWRKKHKVHTRGELKWLDGAVNLLDPDQVAELVALCDELQPIMVIIDTMARSMPGADENAPAPMSQAIEAMDAIRKVTRAAIVIVHHTPKDGSTPRGHSSLLGAVQTSIKVSMTEGTISLSVEKQKDGAPIEMGLRLVRVDDSAVLEHRGTDSIDASLFSEKLVEKVLRENSGPDGLSNSDLQELCDMKKPTFFRARKALMERGRIVQTTGRRWILND